MGQFQLNSYVPSENTSVAIGVFDGVHLGHQAVLKQCREAASEAGLRAVCLTFHPHPLAIVAPDREPAYICSLSQRVAYLLDSKMVDDVVVLPFTRELSQLAAHEFVEQVLIGTLRTQQVCVGADFR